MNIAALNEQFGIPGQLKFLQGKTGHPMIEIENDKAWALISIYAGQVLGYWPEGQDEDLLFLSSLAYYDEGKAIKGGIPVCWPWFGPDPQGKGRPGHGFVRNRLWNLLATELLADGRIRVHLGLKDTEETRAIWPHPFELELRATVGDTLTVELITRNTGSEAFELSQGLHTYFRVGNIEHTRIQGLEGKTYVDKMDGGAEKTQDGAVEIAGEVDRIYTGVTGALEIRDPALERAIKITGSGSASAVVWNPWADTAAAMGDLGDGDYMSLVCVETTNAGPDVVSVPAGGEYRLAAEYGVSAL